MPQPAGVSALADALIEAFRRAQQRITQATAAAATATGRPRRSALTALGAVVAEEMVALRAAGRAWIEASMPVAYEMGARATAAALGETFTWGVFDQGAVQHLAVEVWDDLLSATQYVDDQAKRWIRSEARKQTEGAIVDGRTAEQAARELVKAAAGQLVDDAGPIGVIRYADGSHRRLSDHANMLLRTTTARAYVAGQLNQSKAQGVEWMECFDGDDCGLEDHDDDEKPDGKVYPLAVAEENPLAHPQCRRSWSPRPDITSADEADAAEPSATPEQQADQAQAEKNRTDMLTRRREARTTRTARAARA